MPVQIAVQVFKKMQHGDRRLYLNEGVISLVVPHYCQIHYLQQWHVKCVSRDQLWLLCKGVCVVIVDLLTD